ncbi:GIY-YIG nuclease family protein [Actinomyces sp.]|uniref:GIY-YIG nuclease family protein n=2 Tax=Actinomyces sp. TaxID=29317 RepID=UPI002913BB49|nr:GIY-YIG nuclease family protein [Actinomyces sp.]MDU6757613.1 GIY-YIG nuclease family protein [Actinomyces sp.]
MDRNSQSASRTPLDELETMSVAKIGAGANEVPSELKYARFPVGELDSVSALIPHNRRGIYVLEFSNGEFYVGQAKNVVTRFAQHRHGNTNHVDPWTDVEKLWFMPVPEAMSLDSIEYQEIQRFRASGRRLRNRMWNVGHDQPSGLDLVIPVEDQQAWALGDGPYDLRGAQQHLEDFGSEPTKFARLVPKEYQEPILRDLAFALKELVPSAVELEGKYWTLTDCPSTSGGRWATLNTGFIELLFFPRACEFPDAKAEKLELMEGVGWLNTVPGTVLPGRTQDYWGFEYESSYGGFLDAWAFTATYPSADSDAINYAVGDLEQFCNQYPEVLDGARKFALQAMRQNTSGMFKRWHSKPLVRAVYQYAINQQSGDSRDS